jgi:prolyl-tRNA synthetase
MTTTALPRQSDDFPGWYAAVVRRAQLAEHSPVRGAMVILPDGFAIWEAIQSALDDRIKATGHRNLYFPLFVPADVLQREGELVEGFAPEVAVVTRAGGQELAEPLIIRPTSEAQFWSKYAGWVSSYRDLPLLYNQWANVVRWELRPRLFLRTTEFLWQEGHTAHVSAQEAMEEVLRILHDVYADAVEQVLAIPVLRGRKSAAERFPGAVETFTLEALMRDGKALQSATSHYLGQRFSEAYGVTYTDSDGAERHPHGTSWGASTRLVGGVIMTHGDDRGLRLPPAVAPVQAVVVAIGNGSAVLEAATRLRDSLGTAGVRVHLDNRDHVRPGAKYHEWELRGVPVRIELGPRDLEAGRAVVVRRDIEGKEDVALDGLPTHIPALLADVQEALFADALAFRESRTLRPTSYDEMREFLSAGRGMAAAPWCGSPACERQVKDETRATIRCLPVEPRSPGGGCIVCGRGAMEEAVWAQAY